jgi:uncharacterized SAM-binding protein YcdF (DUF218 family)
VLLKMFVFLSKLLPLLFFPLGLACLLIILAVLLRRERLQRVILVLALLVLWIGGNRWVSVELARSLEWRYLPPEEIPSGEVIVLLGGGTAPVEYPRQIVEMNSAGDRVTYAAWLYHQGKAPHILATGGMLDWSPRGSTPAAEMAELLDMLGVPAEAIWLEDRSRNTYENALYCAQILSEKGIQRILLVTSAMHMPRAVRLFEAQGLEVTPLPTDYTVTTGGGDEETYGDWRSLVLGVITTVDNLALTTRVLKEYAGIFIYELRGWK